ncbi:MAG TPA: VOC family protein [Longimicrobium sp.]|nr:VOC family protein [Longimicrobium sp.]
MSNDSPAAPAADSQPEPFNARSLGASLTVKDLEQSVAWYHGVVGFAVDQRMERDGELRAVAVRAGDVRLLLNKDDGAKGWERAKGEGVSFMITTAQDIDALAARIRAGGGTLDSEPADMPWGVRAFRVRDPDGFRIAFSSPRPS